MTDGGLVVRKNGAARVVNQQSAPDLYAFMTAAMIADDSRVVSIYHRQLGELRLPPSDEPFALHAFTDAPYLEIGPHFSFAPKNTDTFLVRNDTGVFTKIATYFHGISIDQDVWFNGARSHYFLRNGELRRASDDSLITTIPSLATSRGPGFSATGDLVVACVDSIRVADHCQLLRVADGSLIKRFGDQYYVDVTQVKSLIYSV